MSLIIHTIVKDGIVACADSRTTIQNEKDGIRYDDTAEKIIPFPNRMVVGHCGNSKITSTLSVTKFLYKLRESIGNQATILDLPIRILNEYKSLNSTADISFLISGVDFMGQTIHTYKINTKNNEIKLQLDRPGATWVGQTNICKEIMNNNIDYDNLSIKEAQQLNQLCMNTVIESFKYSKNQVVGGQCKIYCIDLLHSESGWLNKNDTLSKDKHADDFAKRGLFYKEVDKIISVKNEQKES